MTTVPHVIAASEMRLAAFIRTNMGHILSEWETSAAATIPDADRLRLRDHVEDLLDFIADKIEQQIKLESIDKSRDEGAQDNALPITATFINAQENVVNGFNIVQMVSEYRALRASVIRLWMVALPRATNTDLADLRRFNEAIDEALAESVGSFTKRVDESRNLVLGILGHDIRNPLGAITASAQLMRSGSQSPEIQRALAEQILESSHRIEDIVDQLIDLSRTELGTGITIYRAHMDVGGLLRTLIEETKARFPERNIVLTLDGDLEGNWDRAALGQVFSNLLGNAVQCSNHGSKISVTIKGNSSGVLITVHNLGAPISDEAILTIFDSVVRTGGSELAVERGSANLGLGLYIAKEIVVSHGGTITVISSLNEGTTFSVALPRV